jgi:UDP-N-acetylglucosamine:LPS N-acetylglucosamine transferase
MKRVLFISSTGGHLSELMKLKPMFKDYDYQIMTEKTKTNSMLKEEFGNRIHYVPYGTQDHLLKYIFIFAFNWIKSFVLFVKYRPEYIITTGTHTAVPMCHIAHLFKAKVIWIETLANATTPTKAGDMVKDIADLIVVQWESMLDVYPDAVYGGWIY